MNLKIYAQLNNCDLKKNQCEKAVLIKAKIVITMMMLTNFYGG